MTFSFTGKAAVEHVNLRKEGATEAKHLAADIKLGTVTASDVLIPFNPALRGLLFNEYGEPRIANMLPLRLDGSIKHLRCRFPAWKLDLADVEAKKFSFAPISGGRVEMVFSIAIDPQANETALLADMLGEMVEVEIGVESDLLADSAPRKPSSATTPGDVAARGGAWNADRLIDRIPQSESGNVLILRAVAAGEIVELRLAKRDPNALVMESGYEMRWGDGARFASPLQIRERGVIDDHLHDLIAEIRDSAKWRQLAPVLAQGWPLSKAFRNVGVHSKHKYDVVEHASTAEPKARRTKKSKEGNHA